jgi:hypothetical protein
MSFSNPERKQVGVNFTPATRYEAHEQNIKCKCFLRIQNEGLTSNPLEIVNTNWPEKIHRFYVNLKTICFMYPVDDIFCTDQQNQRMQLNKYNDVAIDMQCKGNRNTAHDTNSVGQVKTMIYT